MSTRFQLVKPEYLPRRRRVIRKVEIPQSGAPSDGDRPGRRGDFSAGLLTSPGQQFPLANAGGVSCSDPLRSSESSHAKDQEVRCETFQSVRPGQAHASLSGNPAPRQSKILEAETPPGPGQSPGRRPCRAAQTLPAVQPLNAQQPQLRQAGDFQGDPPATTTTLR